MEYQFEEIVEKVKDEIIAIVLAWWTGNLSDEEMLRFLKMDVLLSSQSDLQM